MATIQTKTQDGVTIDFHQSVYEKMLGHYPNLSEFIKKLKYFNAELASKKDLYNINSYPDPVNKGIYILGVDASNLGIFPNSKLALKCSEGKPFTENLRRQFHRSFQLAEELETKLSVEEKNLLQICPVYLHFQSRQPNDFFQQILFMRWIKGEALGDTQSGFNPEFRQVFKIPSLEEISRQKQFALHRQLDKKKHRQLLKIQAVYLFKRLQEKGINIWSLNQKNILVDKVSENGQTKYIIIDPTEDFFPPITPVYNALTSKLCN